MRRTLGLVVGLAMFGLTLAADNTPPEGFTALFNGKDLTGWGTGVGKPASEKQIAEWKIEDGVIKYTGKDGDLWTTTSFKDFVLMLEWRFNKDDYDFSNVPRPKPDGLVHIPPRPKLKPALANADSGIYLRGYINAQCNIWVNPLGSGEVWGYRTNQKLPEEIRKACTPSKNADKPVGQWNSFVITMKGDRLTVVLNGEKVIDNAQLPGVPAEGPIALQHHGTPLDFRNLYIKELKD